MIAKENVQALVPEIMRSLRGGRRQADLSKQLGYKYSIFNRWESGSRIVAWVDFVKLCSILEIDLVGILYDTTGIKFSADLLGSDIATRLSSIGSAESHIFQVISRQKLARLKKTNANLGLVDVLLLIDTTFGRLERFVSDLVGPQKGDRISQLLFQYEDYNKALGADPSLGIVSNLIGLRQYRELKQHSDLVLAKLMGVSEAEMKRKLSLLLDLGMIYQEKGKYVRRIKDVDTRIGGGKQNSTKIHAYWKRELDRHITSDAKQHIDDYKGAYLVYPTCEELERKIFEKSNEYYFEIKNLVDQYRNRADAIRFLNIEIYNPLEKNRE